LKRNFQILFSGASTKFKTAYRKTKTRVKKSKLIEWLSSKESIKNSLGKAIDNLKEIKDLESLKAAVNDVTQKVKNYKLFKPFTSREDFRKMVLEPLNKRIKGIKSYFTKESKQSKVKVEEKKQDSPLWKDLTGHSKVDLQRMGA